MALGLVVLLSSATGAQEAPSPPPFGEVIDVRIINLEAVVVDKSGVRVGGLAPEDFSLHIDGKPVSIDYFTEVVGGLAVERSSGGATAGMPSLAPGKPVGTSFLVFIDNFFSTKAERNLVLRDLSKQVQRLALEDRMAVVAFDGNQLDMLTTWTRSPDILEKVFRRAESHKAYGLVRAAQLRQADAIEATGINDFFRAGRRDAFLELNIGEQEAVRRLTGDVRRATMAASSALRGFAGPPGRRVMLILSGGWPLDPVKWVVRREGSEVLGRHLAKDLWSGLVDTANRLGYTLYTVDVPGQAGQARIGSALSAVEAEANRLNAFEREREEELALDMLARDTGGRSFLDGQRIGAFERVFEDTRSYYWLGFVPDWKGDDDSHDVKLKVLRQGLRLRTRKGYTDLSRTSDVNMDVESALLLGDAPSTEPLRVELGRPEKGGRGKIVVPLTITIPVSSLTFLPTAEGYVAETELRLAVLDEDGNRNEMPVIPLRLRLDAPPAPGTLSRYETAFRIRKKKHQVVVALYDYVSGKMLSTKIDITP